MQFASCDSQPLASRLSVRLLGKRAAREANLPTAENTAPCKTSHRTPCFARVYFCGYFLPSGQQQQSCNKSRDKNIALRNVRRIAISVMLLLYVSVLISEASNRPVWTEGRRWWNTILDSSSSSSPFELNDRRTFGDMYHRLSSMFGSNLQKLLLPTHGISRTHYCFRKFVKLSERENRPEDWSQSLWFRHPGKWNVTGRGVVRFGGVFVGRPSKELAVSVIRTRLCVVPHVPSTYQ